MLFLTGNLDLLSVNFHGEFVFVIFNISKVTLYTFSQYHTKPSQRLLKYFNWIIPRLPLRWRTSFAPGGETRFLIVRANKLSGL